MKQPLYIRAIAGLILLLLFSATGLAGPIRIAFHDTTIIGGRAFDYPVYVDSSLTGSDVSAYQIEFTYNSSIFTFISVRSDSTLTSSWGDPEYNIISPGKIRLAGAGSSVLSGTGKLVILRFAAGVFTYTNAGYFTFQSTLLNQGTPATSKRDGYVYITPPPSITVSPDTWLMTKGETKQFFVSGGKAPYTWSSIDPSVASMNSTGLLTSLTAGVTKAVCVDSAGFADTSGTIEVRALRIFLRDTSRYQGQWLDLPVYVTDATGLGIISGQFKVSYNSNLWTPFSIITAGTLLNGWTVELGTPTQNQMNVVFSSSSQLSGSGILLYVRMKASGTTYGYSTVGFIDPFFNESIPANSSGANIGVIQLPPINVTPGGSHSLVAGDSIKFSASGGTPPYAWTVSDTSRASISSLGWLKGKKSGTVTAMVQDDIGAAGSSGTVNIHDFRLSVPDTSLIADDTVDIPLFVTPNMIGFSSLQFKMTYTTASYVKLIDVISSGTLVEGWTLDKLLSSGSATVAGGGVNSIFAGGTLLKLRFAVPDSTPRPSTINISLSNIVFNQGIPLPLADNGYFTVANSAVFGITPASGLIQTNAVGKKDSAKFTVHNSGTAALTSSISITGSGEFTLSTYNISVPPSADVTVTAYYLPANAGGDTATINFYTNDPYRSYVAVKIIGKVLQFPVLNLSAAAIHFGGVQVGQFKDTTVTITNSGTDTLKISSIAANNGVFTARPITVNIPPGNSFVDTLRFTPASHIPYNARFLVSSNASSSPDTIHVTGTGTMTVFPVLNVSATTIHFGGVTVGQFKDTTVTITNSGTDTLKISSIAANNGVYAARPITANILPGNSFVDTLRFTPVANIPYNAIFLIASNASNSPDTIHVTGNGTIVLFPVLNVSSHTIDFGGVKTGQFKDTTVTITNSGTDTLKISAITANNAVFTARPTTVNILPGASFVDTLRFAPAAVVTYNARFLITSNASSSPDTIIVTGKGETSVGTGMTNSIPNAFTLHQNYPNPFNPSTTIQYDVPASGYVTLKVFDLVGKEAATLVNEHKSAGSYSVTFHAYDLPSGIYFYQLRSGKFVETKRMILMK